MVFHGSTEGLPANDIVRCAIEFVASDEAMPSLDKQSLFFSVYDCHGLISSGVGQEMRNENPRPRQSVRPQRVRQTVSSERACHDQRRSPNAF